jgi:hypothetical protein
MDLVKEELERKWQECIDKVAKIQQEASHL